MKNYCAKCTELDLSKSNERYMKIYYWCNKFEKWRLAHDECLNERVEPIPEEPKIIPKKKLLKRKNKPIPKPEPPIQEPPEVVYEPEPVIEEIVEEIVVESIPLTPEEKKAIRIAELKALIKEAEQ